MPLTTYTSTGSNTFTAPPGVYRVMAQCVGAGGAGGQRSSGNNSGAAGGRGGGYANRANCKVKPGTGYTASVGTGGTDGASPAAGGNTTFTAEASLQAIAIGGPSCAANSQTAPAAPGAGTGDVVFAGGAGGAGGAASGGGGGGAGPTGVGGDATNDTQGTGTAPGANGATGRSTTGVGATGSNPGGGGAGGRRGTSGSQDGGPGGNGAVYIRYLPPNSGMLLGVGS